MKLEKWEITYAHRQQGRGILDCFHILINFHLQPLITCTLNYIGELVLGAKKKKKKIFCGRTRRCEVDSNWKIGFDKTLYSFI